MRSSIPPSNIRPQKVPHNMQVQCLQPALAGDHSCPALIASLLPSLPQALIPRIVDRKDKRKYSRSPESSHRLANGRGGDDGFLHPLRGLERASESGGAAVVGDGTGEGGAAERGGDAGGHGVCGRLGRCFGLSGLCDCNVGSEEGVCFGRVRVVVWRSFGRLLLTSDSEPSSRGESFKYLYISGSRGIGEDNTMQSYVYACGMNLKRDLSHPQASINEGFWRLSSEAGM